MCLSYFLRNTPDNCVTGCYWPLVDGHDRQLSYWIFYTSTGNKWHECDLCHFSAKQPIIIVRNFIQRPLLVKRFDCIPIAHSQLPR